MYATGRGGLARDDREAVRLYKLAAEKGSVEGEFNLGVCYEVGRGVSKDTAEAVRWYRKAADAGYAEAQDRLNKLAP
jgi:TPR repeat protein